jgi:hypothetical protein
MQSRDTNIISVTEKVKAFTGKLGLCVRKLEGKSFDTFSRLKDIVEENNLETSETVTDLCIKDH